MPVPLARPDAVASYRRPITVGAVWYIAAKRLADVTLAAVLLILALPFILLAAILVKLTSRGPVFYSQVRLGLRGRPFRIYKIRTMIHNCEKQSGARWATTRDARVTPIGRLLRRTHVDELPQLWNVLTGSMSLVGPRPERPEFVPQLGELIPHYRDRMLVRPGLTGLAQIQLPADTDLNSVRRKLACDLYYVQGVGFWLDARLMLATAFYLVNLPFTVARLLLRIPSGRPIENVYQQLVAATESVPEIQPIRA
jgi:lipopolysaccharide/colanic/teichoic acid biosynthesis glycosyltransferase